MKIKWKKENFTDGFICNDCALCFTKKCTRNRTFLMDRGNDGMQFVVYKYCFDEFLIYCPKYKKAVFIKDLLRNIFKRNQ